MKNIIIEGKIYTISNNDYAKIEIFLSLNNTTCPEWEQLLDDIQTRYKINERLRIDGIYNY
jgi:hypothetical protein